MSAPEGTPDAGRLRLLFERPSPVTIGAEEEVMTLEPGSLALAGNARELLARLPGEGGFKRELPASQLEIASPPCASVAELASVLLEGRARVAGAAGSSWALAAAGVHPFAEAAGALSEGGRYTQIEREYGWVARRQLISALHVHVRISGAERALAVYNALRSHLPEIAALAANAPIYLGTDSGLASIRPIIAAGLPRQGIPPVLESWEHFAAELSWASRGGHLRSPAEWWWELRPHPSFGTLEVRVGDAQTLVADSIAVIATVACLALWLAERHDAGELPAPAPSWRIAENRWSAARDGVEGKMVDLRSGEAIYTQARLHGVLEAIAPFADGLGARDALERAHALVECNGSQRQRTIHRERGPYELARELVEAFLRANGGDTTTT